MKSPGAKRMQRTRERRRNGTICVEPFPIGGDTLAALVCAGLLPANASTDRAAVSAAVVRAMDAGLLALANERSNEQSPPAEAADRCKDTTAAEAEEAERRAEAELAEAKAHKEGALQSLCETIVVRNVARYGGPP
jgi:hypothetical protein